MAKERADTKTYTTRTGRPRAALCGWRRRSERGGGNLCLECTAVRCIHECDRSVVGQELQSLHVGTSFGRMCNGVLSEIALDPMRTKLVQHTLTLAPGVWLARTGVPKYDSNSQLTTGWVCTRPNRYMEPQGDHRDNPCEVFFSRFNDHHRDITPARPKRANVACPKPNPPF